MWYYSTEAQLEELLQTLDKERWEEELVKNIEDMKEEILRQMTITEQLTAESKGGKKSMLEIENGKCHIVNGQHKVNVMHLHIVFVFD